MIGSGNVEVASPHNAFATWSLFDYGDLARPHSLYPIWTFRSCEVLICPEDLQRMSTGNCWKSLIFSHHRDNC